MMIGQTVSHYRIIGKPGEGGMDVAHFAEDVHLGRPVAVKTANGDTKLTIGSWLRAKTLNVLRRASVFAILPRRAV